MGRNEVVGGGNVLVIMSKFSKTKGNALVGRLVEGCPRGCTLSVSTAAENPHSKRMSNERCFFLSERGFRGVVTGGRLVRCTGCIRGCCNAPHTCIRGVLSRKGSIVLRVRVRKTLGIGRGFPSALLVFIAPPGTERLGSHLMKEKARAVRIVRSEVGHTYRRTRKVDTCSCLIIGSRLSSYIRRVRSVVRKRRREDSHGIGFVGRVGRRLRRLGKRGWCTTSVLC